jgi:hypothetical protein
MMTQPPTNDSMDSEPTENNDLDRRLGKVDLPETRYKADLSLHEHSLEFSSEVLKLGLAGIAVVGFLLANLDQPAQWLKNAAVRVLFSASVVTFALSVVAALAQRFCASSSMFHHFQFLKLLIVDETHAEVQKNREKRKARLQCASLLLMCATGFLVIAAAMLAAAFIRIMSL